MSAASWLNWIRTIRHFGASVLVLVHAQVQGREVNELPYMEVELMARIFALHRLFSTNSTFLLKIVVPILAKSPDSLLLYTGL